MEYLDAKQSLDVCFNMTNDLHDILSEYLIDNNFILETNTKTYLTANKKSVSVTFMFYDDFIMFSLEKNEKSVGEIKLATEKVNSDKIKSVITYYNTLNEKSLKEDFNKPWTERFFYNSLLKGYAPNIN